VCFHVKANLVSLYPDYFAVINSEFYEYVIYQLDFFWCTKTHQAFRVGSTNISLRNQDLSWGDLQGRRALGGYHYQEALRHCRHATFSPYEGYYVHTLVTQATLWELTSVPHFDFGNALGKAMHLVYTLVAFNQMWFKQDNPHIAAHSLMAHGTIHRLQVNFREPPTTSPSY